MTDQSQNGRNDDGPDIQCPENQGGDDHDGVIDFGFRTVRREAKRGMVRDVFDSVASRYDVMNDLMSPVPPARSTSVWTGCGAIQSIIAAFHSR